MLTLRKLLKATPKAILIATKKTRIKSATVKRKKDGSITLKAVVYRPHITTAVPHKCTIEGISAGENKLGDSYVKVQCDCGLFVFFGAEWVLHNKGAAEILYGNGDPPDVRNPSRKYYLCHHLAKLAQVIITKNL